MHEMVISLKIEKYYKTQCKFYLMMHSTHFIYSFYYILNIILSYILHYNILYTVLSYIIYHVVTLHPIIREQDVAQR